MAKTIRIFDPDAMFLINRRAAAERRSAANAAATTILEALLPVYGTPKDAAATIREEAAGVNENHCGPCKT